MLEQRTEFNGWRLTDAGPDYEPRAGRFTGYRNGLWIHRPTVRELKRAIREYTRNRKGYRVKRDSYD